MPFPAEPAKPTEAAPSPSAPYEAPAVVAEFVPQNASPVSAPANPPNEKFSFSTALFGNLTKRGRICKHNWFITLFGNHSLDLRDSYLPPYTNIVIIKFFGDVNLIVPPDTAVSYSAIVICGDRVLDTPEPTGADCRQVSLFMLAPLCGSVRITNE